MLTSQGCGKGTGRLHVARQRLLGQGNDIAQVCASVEHEELGLPVVIGTSRGQQSARTHAQRVSQSQTQPQGGTPSKRAAFAYVAPPPTTRMRLLSKSHARSSTAPPSASTCTTRRATMSKDLCVRYRRALHDSTVKATGQQDATHLDLQHVVRPGPRPDADLATLVTRRNPLAAGGELGDLDWHGVASVDGKQGRVLTNGTATHGGSQRTRHKARGTALLCFVFLFRLALQRATATGS